MCTKEWKVEPDFGEVIPWVMLRPKLLGEGLSELLVAGKIGMVLGRKIEETIEVMNTFELPTAFYEIAFEVTFDGLMQEFDGRITCPSCDQEGVGTRQPLFGQKEPVGWIGFRGFHTRRRP